MKPDGAVLMRLVFFWRHLGFRKNEKAEAKNPLRDDYATRRVLALRQYLEADITSVNQIPAR